MSEYIVVTKEGDNVVLSKVDWDKVVKALNTSRTPAKVPNKANAPKKMRGPYKKKKKVTPTE